MGTGRGNRGRSRAEWLEAGLGLLASGSVEAISVERLSRSLGIAKSGFYWHFRNRDDLLRQMLDHWVHELTEVVTGNEQLQALEPKLRLVTTAETILDYDLARLDMAIRQWALTDKLAARAVRKVNRIRLGFVSEALSELGFDGDELEMRAMLFVCYHTWESAMFREISRKRRRELIARRLELLTSAQG
jgi:AcrR family transcriptional regulator